MKTAAGFSARVRSGLDDEVLQQSLRVMESSRAHMYRLAFDELDDPEGLKQSATAARQRSLTNLAAYLEEFERNVQANGGQVHWAADAAEANSIVAGICAERNAQRGHHPFTERRALPRSW